MVFKGRKNHSRYHLLVVLWSYKALHGMKHMMTRDGLENQDLCAIRGSYFRYKTTCIPLIWVRTISQLYNAHLTTKLQCTDHSFLHFLCSTTGSLQKARCPPIQSPRNPRSLGLIHVSLTQVVSPASVPATVEGYRITEKILLISR